MNLNIGIKMSLLMLILLVGQQRWKWQEWATIGDQPEPPRYLHKTILRIKPGMEDNVVDIFIELVKFLKKKSRSL
jgi:hypothetical protein